MPEPASNTRKVDMTGDIEKVDMENGRNRLSVASQKMDFEGTGSLTPLQKKLRDMADDQGMVDVRQVYELLLREKSLKRLVVVLIPMVLLLIVSNGALAYLAAVLAKDTSSLHGALVDKKTGEALVTENPHDVFFVQEERRRLEEPVLYQGTDAENLFELILPDSMMSDMVGACQKGHKVELQSPEFANPSVGWSICPYAELVSDATTHTFTTNGKTFTFTKNIKGDYVFEDVLAGQSLETCEYEKQVLEAELDLKQACCDDFEDDLGTSATPSESPSQQPSGTWASQQPSGTWASQQPSSGPSDRY